MTTVVLTFYYYTIPILWMGNRAVFVIYVVYGHYLLINIIFHYYMGVFTNPGTPPKVSHSVHIDKEGFKNLYSVCRNMCE